MKRSRYLLTLDGVGIVKPSTTRRKALRSRQWWARRCPGLLINVERVRVPSPI